MSQNTIPPQPALAHSITEGAARIGLGRTKFLELVKAGQISTFKIGKRRLVAEAELERFVRERTGE